MLTLQGYKVDKNSVPNLIQLKTALTVRPYIPSVFVKPQYVQKYPVFVETKDHIFVPKHYGIAEFGLPSKSERDVPKTPAEFWKFEGKIRDNQVEVVNSYLTPEPRDGIISLQTGGGKTVCALYIASQIQVPTIVLVHNTFLRDQWIDRIKAFLPKARIGSLQADVVDIDNKDITVAMLQSVALKEYPRGTFERFGLVIVDECHHIASEAFSRAVPKLTCKHMLGLSATPERKDRLMCVINWFLGPMLYKSDTSDKVDEKVKVEVYEFTGDEKYNEIIYNNSGVMFTTLMINKVVEYEPRNTMVAGLIEDLADEEGRQLLVLTDRVGHTKTLFDLLPDHKKEMACILGRDVPAKTRAEWCASKKILIATYQMVKEGFDVATLNTLIMATPRPDIEQIVGRILRVEKKLRKLDPLIVDIVDESFRRQFQVRNGLYKERGYGVTKMELL
jgi:superfamily II DNA or RNA helicase